MVENGSSGGAPSLPPGDPHDEFLELCALATTDWLSASERKRLDEHLAHCSLCRDALRQYQTLVDSGVPPAALAATEAPQEAEPDSPLNGTEAVLFARLDREEPGWPPSPFGEAASVAQFSAVSRPDAGSSDALWRHMWWQYAAGLILAVALGYSVYRTGSRRGAEMAPVHVPAAAPQRGMGETPPAKPVGANEEALHQRDAEMAALRAQMTQQSAQLASLDREKTALEQKLARGDADHARLAQARDDLARQLDAVQAELQETRERQEASAAQNSADELRVAALRKQMEELRAGVEQKDQELAREQQILDHDQDIRDLMGSRSLYIAEVYDVAKTGDTRKPFGRVFYTKGKSLIFYAYDLDQQPGVRDSSTFQAWGSRGPQPSGAVSLGIFYQDKVANKCWILKAENPKVLSGIDAVFVTVEPHGGSSHPSGKPLLYAYLHIEPNHP